MRTRAEFEAVKDKVDGDPNYAPRLLGVFAADDIFNDEEEEELKALGLVRDADDALPTESPADKYGPDKIGNLVLWGAKQDDPERPYSFNPPTVGEMTTLGLEVLKRRAQEAGKPFAVVIEVESTDNMPNSNNAIGTLRALKRTDDMIGVARQFVNEQDEKTLIITGADSDGSGPQLLALRAVDSSPKGQEEGDIPFNPIQCEDASDLSTCVVTYTNVNPTGLEGGAQFVEVDGMDGRGGKPFIAEPDALLAYRPFPNEATDAPSVPDQRLPFAVVWTGLPDVAGGILSRAEGLNAELLTSREPFFEGEPPFYVRFDNTDIYRMVYLTLFGERLPSGVGVPAESR
jgi:alkaline phosphatase